MASFPNLDTAMAVINNGSYRFTVDSPKNSVEAVALATALFATAIGRVESEQRMKAIADGFAANLDRSRSIASLLQRGVDNINNFPAAKAKAGAELDRLNREIAKAGGGAAVTVPDGYYVDKSGYYFYVTAASVLIIGGPGGSINKKIAAGTETYTKIVATLAKEGKVVNAGVAQASGRQPAPAAPPPVTSLPAVADSPAKTGFLDRLTSDPLGAIMALAMNPWVIGGTAVVAAGLVYLAVNKGKSAPSFPVKANRGRKRRKAVEIEEMEEGDEDIEVEEDEVEEEKPNKRRRRSSKRRRSGKKAR